MHVLRTAILLMGGSAIAATAYSQPVQWSGNGHWYQAVSVPSGISWTQASAAAQAAGGYLATITSAAENSFVFGLIDSPVYWNQEPGGSDLGPWLGGYQTSDNGSTPAANWTWVTAESWSYTHWHPGEPNNFTGAAENYLSFKCFGSSGCRTDSWNDLPDAISEFGTSVIAYVVEFDVLAAVAEPGASRTDLGANAPNPFVSTTAIRFRLAEAGPVRLGVYDATGRLVRGLVSATLPAGARQAVWDGRDDRGARVRAGAYFIRLETHGLSRSVRAIFIP
jgi:hypothetical protein